MDNVTTGAGAPPLRSLEGRRVTLVLRDGGRFENCRLVSAGHPGSHTVRLFVDGIEVFLPVVLIDAWRTADDPLSRYVA